MKYKSVLGILIIISLIVSFSACNLSVQKDLGKVNNDSIVSADNFPADSFAFYENVLINDSLNTDLRLALATNYYAEKQFDKAIEHLLIVCNIDNKNIEALIILGNIYYDSEQNENAIKYYEKALALDNKNVNVRCDLATSYLNIKNPNKALNLLKKNIEMQPNHAQSHHNLSIVYTQLGKTKEAEEQMKIFNKLAMDTTSRVR